MVKKSLDPACYLKFNCSIFILQYLYTEVLEAGSLNLDQLLDLTAPAIKYIVPHLLDKLAPHVMGKVTINNVLELENRFRIEGKLKQKLDEYINRYAD